MKQISIPDLGMTAAASTFAALGSEQRLAVLRTLVRAGPDGLRIGDLGDRTGITGSTLTHHTQERQGRNIICAAVAYDELRALSEFLLRECCADTDDPHEDHLHD